MYQCFSAHLDVTPSQPVRYWCFTAPLTSLLDNQLIINVSLPPLTSLLISWSHSLMNNVPHFPTLKKYTFIHLYTLNISVVHLHSAYTTYTFHLYTRPLLISKLFRSHFEIEYIPHLYISDISTKNCALQCTLYTPPLYHVHPHCTMYTPPLYHVHPSLDLHPISHSRHRSGLSCLCLDNLHIACF